MEEADYRSMLKNEAGVTSARDLDERGFRRVMQRLEELGFRGSNHQPKPARAPGGLVTPLQQKRIEALFTELGFETPEQRRGFCERQAKVPWPQTRHEANQVIEGLKAMQRRGWKAGQR